MTHETPQQRARRLKRDPFRAAQMAPVHVVKPLRCVCGQARLMHRDDRECLAFGCGCTEYREVE